MLWSQQPNNFKFIVEHRKKKSLPCHELMARAIRASYRIFYSKCLCSARVLDVFDTTNRRMFGVFKAFNTTFQY